MPYLKSQNLLFIHIPKNAGRSVELALGFLPPNSLGKMGRRSIVNRVATLFQRTTANVDAKNILYGTLDYTFAAAHLTLQEIQLMSLVPNRTHEGIRSFAVFRDPYQRAVSSYLHFFRSQDVSQRHFEWFCSNWYDQEPADHNQLAHRRSQVDYLVDCRGKMGIDRVLLFENISADFDKMRDEWGIETVMAMPRIGERQKKEHTELFNQACRKRLEKRFSEDLVFYDELKSGHQPSRGDSLWT